jgi:ABC-2 type transport system ATP-binding protein
MTVLQVDKLIKTYPRSNFKLQLDHLEVAEGSILGLLGTNGAGKTTLLKLMLGLAFPQSGTITWTKNYSSEADFVIKNVTYMPEYKNLYPHFSVGHMLKLASTSIPGWSEKKAKHLLPIFPVDLSKKISTLSYGEKTSLYALITLAKDVPYIILDEHSRGLDPVIQERLLKQVKMASQDGKTVIFSSHNLAEIEECADCTAIIKDGRIIIHDYLDNLKSSLFMLVLAGNQELPAGEGSEYFLLAHSSQPGQNAFLCQADESVRFSLNGRFTIYDVSLKDIFLSVNEGGMQYESFNQRV